MPLSFNRWDAFGRSRGELNRDKPRSRRNDTRQASPPRPRKHQTRRNAVPPRDLRHNRAGRQRPFDDPHLIVARPATTTLNPVQNFYPHLPTLRLALKLDPRRIPVTQQGGPPRRNTSITAYLSGSDGTSRRLAGSKNALFAAVGTRLMPNRAATRWHCGHDREPA